MRNLLPLIAAGLVVAAGQAEAKQAVAVRTAERAAASAVKSNGLVDGRISSLGLVATFVIAIGVGAWLLNEAQDSTPVSP